MDIKSATFGSQICQKCCHRPGDWCQRSRLLVMRFEAGNCIIKPCPQESFKDIYFWNPCLTVWPKGLTYHCPWLDWIQQVSDAHGKWRLPPWHSQDHAPRWHLTRPLQLVFTFLLNSPSSRTVEFDTLIAHFENFYHFGVSADDKAFVLWVINLLVEVSIATWTKCYLLHYLIWLISPDRHEMFVNCCSEGRYGLHIILIFV
jgi:hypothetical protein